MVYGVFYSIDDAQSKALIADVELERCASAIAVYNCLTALIYMPAFLGAGALWVNSPISAFFVTACLSLAAIAAFAILRADLHWVSGAVTGHS